MISKCFVAILVNVCYSNRVGQSAQQYIIQERSSRPPYSRRQLHLMVSAKGGVRRKYGGSTTRHGFRKGDLVQSPKGIGYVSGDTEKQVSVSNANWKRLGQITATKVKLIRRSNGLVVA